MKKILLILLSIILFTGCSSGSKSPDDTVIADQADTALSSEDDHNADDEILTIWKTDVTLQDEWVATQDLDQYNAVDITVPVNEAIPVPVDLIEKNLQSDRIPSEKGGAAACYPLIILGADIKEEYPHIWSELNNFNEFALQNAEAELSDGETRYKAYRKKDTNASFIYLHSWTGVEFLRSDSGILSYFRTVYRYNRGYEPDYYELYGRTTDAATGRVLTLNDIFTDTEGLPDMIWENLVRNGRRKETDPDNDELLSLIRAAIRGLRDDGSFAWAVDSSGIEFDFIEKRGEGEKESHIRNRAYIPFSLCEGFLRENITGVLYDYIMPKTYEDVQSILGLDQPVKTDGKRYYTCYMAQKDGKAFLYCESTDSVDIYEVTDGHADKVGEIQAQIGYNQYDHMIKIMDPSRFKLYRTAYILQELFLSADAHIGKDGIPVADELYRPQTNPAPITTGREFEAEVFEDLSSTERKQGVVKESSVLYIERSDGETFVDCSSDSGEQIYRLYVEGNEVDGWTVNGIPMEEAISHQGWWEE